MRTLLRRDADPQYPLHQPDYDQFYDVATGLLRGYRFQSDDTASVPTILVFDAYKRVGARRALVPARG